MTTTLDNTNPIKSYSEEEILAEIQHRWATYGQFDASHITLELDRDKVILRGVVDSRRAKATAEDMALSVQGVRKVHNYLEIDPPPTRPQLDPELKDPENFRRDTGIEGPYPGYAPYLDQYSAPESSFSEFTTALPNSDAELDHENKPSSGDEIAAEINQRLRQHKALKRQTIEVTVNGGQVILKGTVKDPQAKQLADEIVGGVAGVSQVLNQLQVKSK